MSERYLRWNPAHVSPPVDAPLIWHGPHGEHVSGRVVNGTSHGSAGGLPTRKQVIQYVTDAGEVIDYLPSSWRLRDAMDQ